MLPPWLSVALCVSICVVCAETASAQVVIDMPPPPRAKQPASPPPAPPEAATPATVLVAPPVIRTDLDAGRVAMQRYARVRYVPEHRRRPLLYDPFTPDHFTDSFIRHGLHTPFRVIIAPQVIILD